MQDRSLDEEKVLRATDVASDVIGLFDVDGRPLWLNAAGEYLRDFDGTKQDPFRHVHPDDRERVRAEFTSVVRTGETRRLEFRVPQGDGSIRMVQSEATAMRDASGEVVGVLRIGRNVTEERRNAAAALREREELLEAIFEYAPIGISITDADGRFVRVNRWLQSMLGYTEEEFARMTLWDLLPSRDVEENRRVRDDLWSGGRTEITFERRYIRKNGETLWAQNTISLIRDAEGRPRFVMALVEDIRERRLAHAALHATAEKLQALTRRLVDLQEAERRDIARELHDRVGQTLTAMRINMDMIRTRLGDHDDALIRARNDDSLELIQSAFKAVENVLHDLRPPMIDEFGLVAALRWDAKRFAERTEIEVQVRGGEDIRCEPTIELALFRIAQEALHNVARHARARHVDMEVRTSETEVILAIEDDGVGFDFDAREAAGVGYGLITMRERSEAVGGTFEAQSGKGIGTLIRVRAPLRS